MIAQSIFDQLESNVQSYARAFPKVFHGALGAELRDEAGRRYLDFLAGAGSLNYGHNNPILKQALVAYIEGDGITHSLDFHTAAKQRFLEALQSIVLEPRGLDYVVQFTGPTGTNAVEAALKIARKVTGRTNVICFTNGFHGVSTGALAATCNRHHRDVAGVPLHGTTVIPYDGYFGGLDTVEYLDRLLSDPSSGVDDPAAVIVETVQGEGGLNVAGTEWLQRLQALCEAKGILLIIDDIQAGCGRTGTFFSFEPAGIKPDIVTLSKSLSGYGLPFAITLIKRSLDQWEPGEHNGTFRGNNHAFVTAAAALEHFWRTPDFALEVRAKGDHLARRLKKMVGRFLPHLVEVRGRGMMRGVRCADPKRAAAVTAKAFEQGLIIERSGPNDEVIKCLMPLTITKAELDEGLDILEQAMSEEFGETLAHKRPPAFAFAAVDNRNGLAATSSTHGS
ncbi:MAG: diaminobutyrate--2-oxoglutarate transaminase [Geminicoccaceae bacterium]